MRNFKNILADLINTQPDESYSKLTTTTMIQSWADADTKILIEGLYASAVPAHKMTASVLNAVFTERKATFLFSKRILEDLIKQDKNIDRSSVNSESFKKICDWWSQTGLFYIAMDGGDDRKASVLELAKDELLTKFDSMVGKDFRSLQRERCLEVFHKGPMSDKTSQENPKTSPKIRSLDLVSDNESDSALASDLDDKTAREQRVPFKGEDKKPACRLAPEQIAAIKKSWKRLDLEDRVNLKAEYPKDFGGLS